MFLSGILYNENMEANIYDKNLWKEPCPRIECKKRACCCGLEYVAIPAALTAEVTPEKGRYANAIVQYEETGEVYIYSAEGIPVKVKEANAS